MNMQTKARFAGIAGVCGGLIFFFYFYGLNPLLDSLNPSLDQEATGFLKMLICILTSLLFAGIPMGLLALGAAGTGRWKRLAVVGAWVMLAGVVSYITGVIYIYLNPDRAFRQLFTPGGSFLLTIGLLLMGAAVLKARVLQGWRRAAALITGLYFPLQFPLQAMLFLGAGKGPHPYLLGGWGLFWALLGSSIWVSANRIRPEATVYELANAR